MDSQIGQTYNPQFPERNTSDKKLPINQIAIFILFILAFVGIYFIVKEKDTADLTQQVAGAQVKESQERKNNNFLISDFEIDNQITVEKINLSQPSFIVVHDSEGGFPRSVIGSTSLLPGAQNQTAKITLDRVPEEDEILFVMIHKDDGDQTLEFPGDDTPIEDEWGNLIMQMIPVRKPAGEENKEGGE